MVNVDIIRLGAVYSGHIAKLPTTFLRFCGEKYARSRNFLWFEISKSAQVVEAEVTRER